MYMYVHNIYIYIYIYICVYMYVSRIWLLMFLAQSRTPPFPRDPASLRTFFSGVGGFRV